jgi:hypothetical protein
MIKLKDNLLNLGVFKDSLMFLLQYKLGCIFMQDTDQKDVQKNVNKLIEEFYSRSNELVYSNLNEDKKYAGWVSDFHLRYRQNDEKIFLDLNNKNDIFLLFILAIAWSRPGPWENAPYLISYIKYSKNDNKEYWIDRAHIENEIENSRMSSRIITRNVYGIIPRKQINFRKDIFYSINILAKKWSEIYNKLFECSQNHNYIEFMHYLHNINGLGCGNKGILIKIPLILRELRCQNIFNIPGDICCVIDDRVSDACKEIGIDIPKSQSSIDCLKKSSNIIYSHFGDLYDIPLFAYNDIYNNQE